MDALRELREIETEAENIKKQASVKAREKIKLASEQAEKEFNSVVEEAQNLALKLVKEKEDEAKSKAKPILESGEGDCSKLRSIPDAKVKKAAQLVVERIVKFYGKG